MNKEFNRCVVKLALPVTLQSLLQSSFSVVDQVMIGQLGSSSIAGIGLAGKFASLYSVLIGAIATAAGILMAQYIGKKDEKAVSRSFWVNICLILVFAVIFIVPCVLLPKEILGIYTADSNAGSLGAQYLKIVSISYIPMAISLLVSTLLRCMNEAIYPLYASIVAVIMNTGLNYLLIFGKAGMPKMGVAGAAVATVVSHILSCVMVLLACLKCQRKWKLHISRTLSFPRESRKQYLSILLPILACEFLWSLGENVYAGIYGNLGTNPCAAMTLTIPIQTLMIGALSGLAQAAGILIGKTLGQKDFNKAYKDSKTLMWYGFAGSLILSMILVCLGRYYVLIYQVSDEIRHTAYLILLVFAFIAPIKVQNMILSGGIIRSGGKTKYVMYMDMIGTWFFGVPLGLLAAFVWKLPIPLVYLTLSVEECIRLGMGFFVFRRKRWMKSLGE